MPEQRRIGAILSGDSTQIVFLGYGVYVGDEIPPYPPPMIGLRTWEELDTMLEEQRPSLEAEGRWPFRPTNPKLLLDNGDIVWGQECWWGDEEEVKKRINAYQKSGLRTEEARIEDSRRDAGYA